MRTAWRIGALVLLVGVLAGWWALTRLSPRGPEAFESEIAAFEAADRAQPPRPGAILFTGSSSIRRWTTLARDMAPLVVLNRGFGGAYLSHVAHYAPRILGEQRPAALVVYAGDNDIASGKSAETVAADFRALVEWVRDRRPDTPVYYLTIKPSLLRFARWPEMRRANERVAAWATTQPQVHVIDVSSAMLDSAGQPRRELFAWDGLHLSESGYALWTSLVRPPLEAAFGAGRGSQPGS